MEIVDPISSCLSILFLHGHADFCGYPACRRLAGTHAFCRSTSRKFTPSTSMVRSAPSSSTCRQPGSITGGMNRPWSSRFVSKRIHPVATSVRATDDVACPETRRDDRNACPHRQPAPTSTSHRCPCACPPVPTTTEFELPPIASAYLFHQLTQPRHRRKLRHLHLQRTPSHNHRAPDGQPWQDRLRTNHRHKPTTHRFQPRRRFTPHSARPDGPIQ
jgi:hypothetical protein